MNKDITKIDHATEVHSFSRSNTMSVEARKALYDGIERDLKAIWNEVVGFDLNEGYYLKFNKNEDGSWKTDLSVSIDADEAFWESDLRPKNKNIEQWCSIKEVEDLFEKSIVANFPARLCPIFEIEAESGDRWSKKAKLRVGAEYGSHHYKTNAQREAMRNGSDEDVAPTYRAYSSFKEIKGKYEHNQIKLDKAYKMFKYYVVQFFARIEELKAGYEKAKVIAFPHNNYLNKLRELEEKRGQINERLISELQPDRKPGEYAPERVFVNSDTVRLRDAKLYSAENIDITLQILDLVEKLKFTKE